MPQKVDLPPVTGTRIVPSAASGHGGSSHKPTASKAPVRIKEKGDKLKIKLDNFILRLKSINAAIQAGTFSVPSWLLDHINAEQFSEQLSKMMRHLLFTWRKVVAHLREQSNYRCNRTVSQQGFSFPRSWSMYLLEKKNQLALIVNLKIKTPEIPFEKNDSLVIAGAFKHCKPALMIYCEISGSGQFIIRFDKVASLTPNFNRWVGSEKYPREVPVTSIKREAKLLKNFTYLPGLVKLYASGEYISRRKGSTVEMIQPHYMTDLFELANYPAKFGSSYTDEAKINIIKTLLHTLAKLQTHEPPLVHCDIKPENILIKNDYSPRLGDIESLAPANRRNNLLIGTVAFFSPELHFAISIILAQWFTAPAGVYEKTDHFDLKEFRDNLFQTPELLAFKKTETYEKIKSRAKKRHSEYAKSLTKSSFLAHIALNEQLDKYVEFFKVPQNFIDTLKAQLTHDWWAAGLTMLQTLSSKHIFTHRLYTKPPGTMPLSPSCLSWWRPIVSRAMATPDMLKILRGLLAPPLTRVSPAELYESIYGAKPAASGGGSSLGGTAATALPIMDRVPTATILPPVEGVPAAAVASALSPEEMVPAGAAAAAATDITLPPVSGASRGGKGAR